MWLCFLFLFLFFFFLCFCFFLSYYYYLFIYRYFDLGSRSSKRAVLIVRCVGTVLLCTFNHHWIKVKAWTWWILRLESSEMINKINEQISCVDFMTSGASLPSKFACEAFFHLPIIACICGSPHSHVSIIIRL